MTSPSNANAPSEQPPADTGVSLNECCAQRDELWRDVTGWDLLGDVTRRLDSMNAQLNAAKRHQEGRRWVNSKLPQVAEIPLAYGVVLPIPLDVEGEPVSYEQAMSNLMSATATSVVRAVANGRWAVNEHQRAQRYETLLDELAAAWERMKEPAHTDSAVPFLEMDRLLTEYRDAR